MEEWLQCRIRERAYEIWKASGQIHGEAEQHWFVAEREIQSSMAAEIVALKPVASSKLRRQTQPMAKIQSQGNKAAKAAKAG